MMFFFVLLYGITLSRYIAFASTNFTSVSVQIVASKRKKVGDDPAHLFVVREQPGNWNVEKLYDSDSERLYRTIMLGEQTREFLQVPTGECYQFTASNARELTVQVNGQPLLSNEFITLPPVYMNAKALVWYVGDCSAPQCKDDEALLEQTIVTGFNSFARFDWMIRHRGQGSPLASCAGSSDAKFAECFQNDWMYRRERLCLPRDSCYELIWVTDRTNCDPFGRQVTAQASFDGAIVFNGAFQSRSFQFGTTCSELEPVPSVELFYHLAPSQAFSKHMIKPLVVQYHIYSGNQLVSGPLFETMFEPVSNHSRAYYLAIELALGSCMVIEPFQCSTGTDLLLGRITYNGSIYAEETYTQCPQDGIGGGSTVFVGDCASTICQRDNDARIELRVTTHYAIYPESLDFDPRVDYWTCPGGPDIDWKIEGEINTFYLSTNGYGYVPESKYVNFYCAARDSCTLLKYHDSGFPYGTERRYSYEVLVDGSPVPPTANVSQYKQIMTRLVDVDCPLLPHEKWLQTIPRAAAILGGFLVVVVICVLWRRRRKQRAAGYLNDNDADLIEKLLATSTVPNSTTSDQ